jgi:Uma2 family endonuclease
MVAQVELALRSHDATWDRARWEQLPDDGNRYEVIDGVLYMSTAPSFFHQRIIQQVFLRLYAQIDERGAGLTVWSPLGVFMPGCDPVQPDLLVIRTPNLGIIRDRHVEGVPDLLAEVLSPSNASVDLATKRMAYARAGVPEYWVMRPAQRDVLVYSQPDAARGDFAQSRRFGGDEELVSPTLSVRFGVAGIGGCARYRPLGGIFTFRRKRFVGS